MILLPTPITLESPEVTGVWVKHITASFGTSPSLFAQFAPFSGPHLLSSDIPPLRVAGGTTEVDAVLNAIETEVNRQSGKTNPKVVSVVAPRPGKSVRISVNYGPQDTFVIHDAYALFPTDATFASVFDTTMGAIAALAGLQIQ